MLSIRVLQLTPSLYTLAICAFGVATFHFGTEWLIFGTVKLNRASIGPLLVGCELNRTCNSLTHQRPVSCGCSRSAHTTLASNLPHKSRSFA